MTKRTRQTTSPASSPAIPMQFGIDVPAITGDDVVFDGSKRFKGVKGLENRAFIQRSVRLTQADDAMLIAEARRQGRTVTDLLRCFIQTLRPA